MRCVFDANAGRVLGFEFIRACPGENFPVFPSFPLKVCHALGNVGDEGIVWPRTRGGERLTAVEDYIPLIGNETTERILKKVERVRDLHVAHVNSTYYGGGVAESSGAGGKKKQGFDFVFDWSAPLTVAMPDAANFFWACCRRAWFIFSPVNAKPWAANWSGIKVCRSRSPLCDRNTGLASYWIDSDTELTGELRPSHAVKIMMPIVLE
jgi:hypothetical protein